MNFARARNDGLVQTAKPYLHRSLLHAGPVEHVPQTHPGPERIAHRAVRPLRARNARLHVNARVSGALADRGELHARQTIEDVVQRQRQRLIDLPPRTARRNLSTSISLGKSAQCQLT